MPELICVAVDGKPEAGTRPGDSDAFAREVEGKAGEAQDGPAAPGEGLDLSPIRLVVVFAVAAGRVWAELADLGSHPEWMGDAGSVEFVTAQTKGVGTRMRVPTRIGPFRTIDVMTVVEWEEERLIEVEHLGAVRGRGRFEIRPLGSGAELTWSETLSFPWWLGGPLGAWLARPVLRRIWMGNLERLRRRLAVSGP